MVMTEGSPPNITKTKRRGIYTVDKRNSPCFQIKWNSKSKTFQPQIVQDTESRTESIAVADGPTKNEMSLLIYNYKEKQDENSHDKLEECIPILQRIYTSTFHFQHAAKVLQLITTFEAFLFVSLNKTQTIHHQLLTATGLLYMSQIYVKIGSITKARHCGKSVIQYILSNLENQPAAQKLVKDAKHSIRQAIKYEQLCYKCEKECSQTQPTRESLDKIDQALEIAPWSMRALRLKTTILLATDMFQQAIDFLSNCTATETDFQLSVAHARAFDYNGLTDDAILMLRRLIQRYPRQEISKMELKRIQQLKTLKDQADVLFTSGHHKEAEEKYTQGIQLDPNHKAYQSIMYSRKAAVLLATGREKDAIADLTKAVQLNSKNTEAIQRLERAKSQLHAKNMVSFLTSVIRF